jgi:hypothetical protein
VGCFPKRGKRTKPKSNRKRLFPNIMLVLGTRYLLAIGKPDQNSFTPSQFTDKSKICVSRLIIKILLLESYFQ